MCEAILENIKRKDVNTYYDLQTKGDKVYTTEGIFLDFEKAYAAGVKGNVPFYIEKCKFSDCARNYAD